MKNFLFFLAITAISGVLVNCKCIYSSSDNVTTETADQQANAKEISGQQPTKTELTNEQKILNEKIADITTTKVMKTEATIPEDRSLITQLEVPDDLLEYIHLNKCFRKELEVPDDLLEYIHLNKCFRKETVTENSTLVSGSQQTKTKEITLPQAKNTEEMAEKKTVTKLTNEKKTSGTESGSQPPRKEKQKTLLTLHEWRHFKVQFALVKCTFVFRNELAFPLKAQ
ncbi:unnamed protein product [Schistosoma turkestanicum]|nr:unnamed protein product [Schistosoma turkestanicum]